MTELLLDLLRAIQISIWRIHYRLNEWQATFGEMAPPAAKSLAQLTEHAAEKISIEADKYYQDILSNIIVEHDALISLNKRIRFISYFLDLLEHCTQHAIHPILSPALQTILSENKIGGQVLVATTSEISYELLPLVGSNFKGSVDDEILSKIEWPIFVFRVPHSPSDWPLNHVLLFHEIGHAQFNTSKVTFSCDLPIELKRDEADAASDIVKKFIVGRKINTFREIYAHWAEELFSDAIGIIAVGPSFASGFCRVIGGNYDIKTASVSHPPSAFRISLMGEILNSNSLLASLSPNITKIFSEWSNYCSKITSFKVYKKEPELEYLLPMLISKLKESHQKIVDKAKEITAMTFIDRQLLMDIAERGNNLYALSIPPVEEAKIPNFTEAGSALSPAKIFGSCWAAYYKYIDENREKIGDGTMEWRLSYMLLGSLDAADALRKWTKK